MSERSEPARPGGQPTPPGGPPRGYPAPGYPPPTYPPLAHPPAGAPRRSSSRTGLIAFLAIVLVIGGCGLGVLGFGVRSGPDNQSVAAGTPFDPPGPNGSVAYRVTVHYAPSTPPGTEGLVTVATTQSLSTDEALTLTLTPQDPPGLSRYATGVGTTDRPTRAGSNAIDRNLTYRHFAACAGCDRHFALVVTAGPVTAPVDLSVRAEAVGWQAASAAATPTVVLDRQPPSPATVSKTVAIDPTPPSPTGEQVTHLSVRGPAAVLQNATARLVTTRRDHADSSVIGSEGPATMLRSDPGAPARATAPGDLLALSAGDCRSICTIGLWIVVPSGREHNVELLGSAETLDVHTDTTRSNATSADVDLAGGVDRTLETDSSGAPPATGPAAVQALTIVTLSSLAGGPPRGHLDSTTIDVANEPQTFLAEAPCAGSECTRSRSLHLDSQPGGTARIAATTYSAADGSSPRDAVHIELR